MSIFSDGATVIITRIVSGTPGSVSFEATDLVNQDSWLIFDRSWFSRLRIKLVPGDHIYVEGLKTKANKARYKSSYPVIQASQLQLLGRFELASQVG